MIALVNYNIGNLRSVLNALEAIGEEAFIANSPKDLEKADKIILPGVGAFSDGMENLEEGGWLEGLSSEVKDKGKPFLGICLGMQLLATLGTEHKETKGMGLIDGKVVLIDKCGNEELRIPHIGWNDVNFDSSSKLYAGMENPQAFYFVHSYVYQPVDKNVISGVCSYGSDLVASIEQDNVYAVQFHPEKSHKVGLALLKNFAELKS